MSESKHTPGPWTAFLMGFGDTKIRTPKCIIADVAFLDAIDGSQFQANARLIAAAPDRHDQMVALSLLDWSVEKRSLYDEEGVEGWAWIEPDGTEHVEVGDWEDLPPWPNSARAAIAKATQP